MRSLLSRRSASRAALVLLPILGAFAVNACSSDDTPASATNLDAGDEQAPDADEVTDAGDEDAGPPEAPQSLEGCTPDPGPPMQDGGADAGDASADAGADPIGGADKLTLADALAGYPDVPGVLTALITTEEGAIRCELFEKAAPITVANFVGLARGTRPYLENGVWKTGRFYDGLLWHRVIPGFVIQGGDPLGNGTGGPGYDGIVENQVDEPLGTLAEAARIKPSGSQFYVVVGKGPAPKYNVFGTCTTAVAIKIASTPRDKDDRPKTDVHMKRIDIARCPAK